ncbi:MAG: GH92 family glycosyl hydrolase [Kiritimatiellae bacterium]|nr:GH92 family glycosyl hydrolase [Kiritimatiellia bacterium]
MKATIITAALVMGLAGFAQDKAPAEYVNPFIGCADNGHCFPAACVPFGLVQAGADTGNKTWRYCGGYNADDTSILGFSQTHISGTGVPDLGDIRLQPFVGTGGTNDFRSAFRKETETAKPGYYAVTLDDFDVQAEVTVTHHASIYRFTYGKGGPAQLLVDSQYGIGGDARRQIVSSDVRLDGRTGIAGTVRRRCWVDRTYAFAVQFDRPFSSVAKLPSAPGEQAPRYVFSFDVPAGGTLAVKVGLSAEGGVEAAWKNLAAEIPAWDFAGVRAKATEAWNKLLARVAVKGDDAQKTSFYTALYHLYIQPNNIADVGQPPFHSTFSCWDTFRAAHPLYTILVPEQVDGFVNSMLEQGRRTGFLPVWTLWGKDNQCMIGTHSVPAIVDAYLKGFRGFDVNDAYAQVKDTLTNKHETRRKERWDLLDKYGYYPFDEIKGESVSRTMECAYDDWCAAQFAAALGKAEDAAFFSRRAGNWSNVLDRTIGFVRGRDSKGNWREPYDPFAFGHGAGTANDFTEGNAFQYTWHVMQDPEGLIAALGGKDAFVKKLDALFTQEMKVNGPGLVLDISGLIGQYVHGNEPSHHVAYFYPFAGRSDRTAEVVREVFDRFYLPKADGLCGNDDCGQMSAWYVFSAMGFYPFNPCGGDYVLGAPQVPKVTVALPGGKKFTVVAKNLSKENKYVKSVTLDGKPVSGFILKHADIMAGGELVFEMAASAR